MSMADRAAGAVVGALVGDALELVRLARLLGELAEGEQSIGKVEA